MVGGKLVTHVIPASTRNFTSGRSRYGKISEITVHHCAGITSVEALGKTWQNPNRAGSSHYGVYQNHIGQYVSESDIAWTNSNWASNCRAVTIETSNSGGSPNWPVDNTTLGTLIKLVADIAKRNGLHPLVLGKTLTWHSMYTATACPGPYLRSKLQYVVDEANKINNGPTTESGVVKLKAISSQPVVIRMGVVSSGDAAAISEVCKGKGIPRTYDGSYLTTDVAVSSGDQPEIITKAYELGVPFGAVIGFDSPAQVNELKARIALLETEHTKLAETCNDYASRMAAARSALGV